MGETGMLDVDANSAKAVLEVIGRILGVKFKMTDIENLKRETEKMLGELEAAGAAQLSQPEAGRFREDPSYIR